MTSIGESAFRSCTNLTSITIPNSVIDIVANAFTNCTNLKSITIPESATSIGAEAFKNCKGLTSITIPNSVTSIGESAFYGCTNLTSITIPNSVIDIAANAFTNCANLKSITIPESATSIGAEAFSGCRSLTSLVIPNSVKSIGDKAFYGCSGLTSVAIGESVTSIGAQAFNKCPNIKSVTCHAIDIPEIGLSCFSSDDLASAKLEIPEGSSNEYKSAKQWKDFGTFIEIKGKFKVRNKNNNYIASTEIESAGGGSGLFGSLFSGSGSSASQQEEAEDDDDGIYTATIQLKSDGKICCTKLSLTQSYGFATFEHRRYSRNIGDTEPFTIQWHKSMGETIKLKNISAHENDNPLIPGKQWTIDDFSISNGDRLVIDLDVRGKEVK